MKLHILLVDDDNDEIEILCSALNQAGIDYKCTWAQGVDHALLITQYIIPDTILIDFNMPVKNGLEGIRLLRSVEKLRHVPLVMYSNSINTICEEALAAGADACISKPSTTEGLIEIIHDLFSTAVTH